MLAGYDHLLAAARRLQWNAEAISLQHDLAALDALPTDVRAAARTLTAGFVVAEHAVAEQLEPFVAAAGDLDPDPRARECFRAQANDERRHARWFDRLAAELFGLDRQTARAAAPGAVRELFESELPAAARALAASGASRSQMAAAVGLYHVVLEGIAFAVGQEALLELAREHGLHGVADGVARVQGDERWHVGLGVLALQRLGAPLEIEAPARRALTAWGPSIATPERTERVLAAHARRLTIASARPLTESRPA
ncbi:MAG TPA: ribonucleotide-diphosphate reductase subunit beta [Solirubrobacteraceae bacterium]|nr:ribonucleotide-diphosphate reductase subunit beta [Solirubrobacteraceae bacterium]